VDRLTNETRRISMGMGGAEPNGPSFRPSISADGKWVAFDSQASNLVKDDENGDLDRAIELLDEQSRGQLEPPTSDGATFIRDQALDWAGSDVFVVQVSTGDVELVSRTTGGEPGNLGSHAPSISQNGQYVAFESFAPNLSGFATARGGPPAGASRYFGADIYIRDRENETTTAVSRPNDDGVWEMQLGSGRPAMTPDGEFVVFVSRDARLAGTAPPPAMGGVYVWSRQSGELRSIKMPTGGQQLESTRLITEGSQPAISSDGKLVAFAAAVLAPDPQFHKEGLWILTDGAQGAVLVPGTELLTRFRPVPLSFGPDGDILVTSAVQVQASGTSVSGGSVYDVKMKQLTPIQLPTGTEGSWMPVLSGDGRWITAAKFLDYRSPSGAVASDIVVFSR
jgi:Tol biopolymer transport system component